MEGLYIGELPEFQSTGDANDSKGDIQPHDELMTHLQNPITF